MISASRLDPDTRYALIQQEASRMEGLRNDRLSFWAHWAQLAEVFLPRRYKWFITPNQTNRGSQMNQSIVDETGVLAARVLSSGMMSGLTSPTRPWFKLGLHDLDPVELGPGAEWLAEVERRMMRVFAESNFYTSLGTLYHDNAVFGSASMCIYEDPDQVIRCYNPCLGEFFFGVNDRLSVDTLYREFTYTVKQVVDRWGLENVSDDVKLSYQSGGALRSKEIVVCHGIEPNGRLWDNTGAPLAWAVPPRFKWREVYWEKSVPQNAKGTQILSLAGYNEKPFVGARWDIVSNDAYGRSPGMDAFPAVRQLQIEQRRKAEAIDKLVRPPMVGSPSMKNEPASILPGGITYVADVGSGQSGFRPAFQVDPRLSEMVEDIQEVQARVKSIFFVDLFMMISNLDTVRTATEIDARREEKLIQLGPVIERFENEVLDPVIDRVFGIMSRRGLLPPPPPEIAGETINVQYVSMLAEAQRAASTSSIERFLAMVGNIAAVQPDVVDIPNWDKLLEDYARDLSVDPAGVNSAAKRDALRAQRAQQQQQAAITEATPGMAQAASNLSKTNVGGGQNALSLMLNG